MLKRVSSWLKQNKLILGIASIFFALGLTLGIGINYRLDFSMHFDDKVNPTDLLQVFVGVILVWVIANSLEKRKQAERNSKEIVQRRVRDLHSFVDDFSEHAFTDQYEYTRAVSALKRIETGFQSIQRLMKATGVEFPGNLMDDGERRSAELYDLLTNIPVRDKLDGGNVELEVKGGICQFADDRLAKINEAFDNLKNALLELEIRVNIE